MNKLVHFAMAIVLFILAIPVFPTAIAAPDPLDKATRNININSQDETKPPPTPPATSRERGERASGPVNCNYVCRDKETSAARTPTRRIKMLGVVLDLCSCGSALVTRRLNLPPPPPPPPLTRGRESPEQWFTQSLDHFHPTDSRTWQQRYWENFEHYQEGGPTFIYIEGERESSPRWFTYGVLPNLAKEQGGAMFIVEHRFYGQSKPTSNLSTENLVYLTSQQALADLAEFITAMKDRQNLNGPWIALGGSYAGSLAAWLRYRYPHLVAGAISSSAPLLAKADFHEYFEIVMSAMDFTGMHQCNPAISAAMAEIHQLVATEEGSARLTKLFKLCNALEGNIIKDVSMFYENIVVNLAGAVQKNGNSKGIYTVCNQMTDEESGTPLERFAELNSLSLTLQDVRCLDHRYSSFIEMLRATEYGRTRGYRQWIYQTCTEFGWYQTSNQKGHPYGDRFPLEFFEQLCTDVYGPDFGHNMLTRAVAATNVEYGGKHPDVDKVVFVHGSIDPWHAMGVIEDLSDDAPAIYINGTSHCQDMFPTEDDPLELKEARVRIRELVDQWIRHAKI